MTRTVSKQSKLYGLTIFMAVMGGATVFIAVIGGGCGTSTVIIHDCPDASAQDGGGAGGGGAGGQDPFCKK